MLQAWVWGDEREWERETEFDVSARADVEQRENNIEWN